MTETMEWMAQRHSVRKYSNRAIEAEKRVALDRLTREINQEADLHIQILYEEPKCFDSFLAHYGKFQGVCNYIALVGKNDRNLEEKLGYYGEKLVHKAQELGLNTCWVAMTHGKSAARVAKGEKLVCLISLGYGTESGVAHKSKTREAVCRELSGKPAWFLRGLDGALLAPTAMNQQKFTFTLEQDGKVTAQCGGGFYTRLDLGIVKYHFEVASGVSVERD